MQKSYFSFIFDFLFYSFVIFLITFVWVRMLVHSEALIWIYSLSITLIISILLFIVLKKKIYNYSCSKKEIKEKQQILNSFIFAQNNEIINFLTKFFNDFQIKKHSEFFEVKNLDTKIKYIVFYDFSLSPTNVDTIIKFVKKAEKENISNIYIFCGTFEMACTKFIKNLKEVKIKIIDFNNFYENFIKKQNIKPNMKEKYAEKNKYSFKELLSIAFNKNKTKQYFLTGIIFLIGSIFLRYNIYYLLFTSLMFLFCLFSYFNKIYNKKTDDPFKLK